MNEIYLITRFDGILTVFTVFLILSAIALGIWIYIYLGSYCEMADSSYSENEKQEFKAYQKLAINGFKICAPLFICCCLGVIFIPSTKQALMIYGIGGTVDYLKQNPTAKQLPDKCIKAIDRWVDTVAADSATVEK